MTNNTRLTITFDNLDYEVEINGNTFIVNGQPFVIGTDDRDGCVTIDGIAYDVVLDGESAVVDGVTYQVRISGLNRRPPVALPAAPPTSDGEVGEIRAIMPGTIVQVSVAEGDAVAENDVVVVLEAMKMENELRAPTDGRIGAVFVHPGQTVEMNTVLVRIDVDL
jgi:biotin carboxyl carrier protein